MKVTDHFENSFLFSCNGNSGNCHKLLWTMKFFWWRLLKCFGFGLVCFSPSSYKSPSSAFTKQILPSFKQDEGTPNSESPSSPFHAHQYEHTYILPPKCPCFEPGNHSRLVTILFFHKALFLSDFPSWWKQNYLHIGIKHWLICLLPPNNVKCFEFSSTLLVSDATEILH